MAASAAEESALPAAGAVVLADDEADEDVFRAAGVVRAAAAPAGGLWWARSPFSAIGVCWTCLLGLPGSCLLPRRRALGASTGWAPHATPPPAHRRPAELAALAAAWRPHLPAMPDPDR